MRLLGVQIDDELDFNGHINKIRKSAGNQKKEKDLKDKEVLVSSFTYSNFYYCSLLWVLSHKKLLDKVETLPK